MSRIEGKTALVTGANRGIGEAFVQSLLAAGVTKIYASARRPDTLDQIVKDAGGKVVAVTLDVTDKTSIEAAARQIKDVDILINNAGVAGFQGILSAPDDSAARNEMEVNYFGVFDTIRAFAPVLAANGGGTIINISSIASHVNFPVLGSYSASKAAAHSLTQSVRAELASQGTTVVGVYPGPVDTDLAKPFPAEKTDPRVLADAILRAVEEGQEDVFPDPVAQGTYDNILADPKAVEREVGQMLPA